MNPSFKKSVITNHLKFRSELFNNDICKVVALDEIKGHFPQGTTFEDYWPAKGSIEPVSSRSGVSGGNWTQKPPGQPVTKPATVGAGGRIINLATFG